VIQWPTFTFRCWEPCAIPECSKYANQTSEGA
jgi:hypothetical protein